MACCTAVMRFAYTDTRHCPKGPRAQVSELVLHREPTNEVEFTNEKGNHHGKHGSWFLVKDPSDNMVGLCIEFSCSGGRLRNTMWVRSALPFAFECITVKTATMRCVMISAMYRSPQAQLAVDDDNEDQSSEISFVLL